MTTLEEPWGPFSWSLLQLVPRLCTFNSLYFQVSEGKEKRKEKTNFHPSWQDFSQEVKEGGTRGYNTVERLSGQEAGDEGPRFASYMPQDQKHVTGSLWICIRGLDR